MRRFTLRTAGQLDVPAAAEKARELRRLDDGLHPPDISGLDLYETRDALTKHQAAVDAVKADRARAANAAVSPWWRTRPAKLPDGSPNDWPPWRDIDAWRGLGASHALLCTPSRLETTHRPHEQAYDSAYRAVFGAYMDTPEVTPKPAQDAWQPPAHPPMLGPWRTSAHSTPLLDEAMCKAQEMLDPALKTSKNPHFKSTYADLAEIIAVVKPAFSHARIARYQAAWTDDKPGVVITTRLAHMGEWCEADLRIPVDKSNAQALGAAVTYGKRFGLAAMAGVPTEDDDGNAAAAAPPKRESTPQPDSFVACSPGTQRAIGLLCTEIAMLANTSRDDVLKAAWKGAGYPYNADVSSPGDISPAESIEVQRWLETDRKNYPTDDDQSAAGAP